MKENIFRKCILVFSVLIFCISGNIWADDEAEESQEAVIPLKTRYAPQEREIILGFDFTEQDEAFVWTSTFEFEYSFWNRLEFDLELPLVARFSEESEGLEVEEIEESIDDSAGLGDIETGLKLKLIESQESAFNLAGGFEVTWPTGDVSDELGEGKTEVGPYLAFSKRFCAISLLGSVGYERVVDTDEDAEEGEKDIWSLDAAIAYTFAFGLSALFEVNSSFETEDIVLVTPGLIYQMSERFQIRSGVQIPVTSEKEFDWNTIFQLLYEF